jgi:hypothetical protein
MSLNGYGTKLPWPVLRNSFGICLEMLKPLHLSHKNRLGPTIEPRTFPHTKQGRYALKIIVTDKQMVHLYIQIIAE